MPTCGSCGRESAEGFAFCPHCGAPLQAARPAEARKIVTVLFCDVTGSTSLGERLDPESLRKVMARYFDEARARVERHGGTVEKFIGDAVMAVFGIPRVHEDDALRACRAAAEIQASVVRLSKELERDFGTPFQARIGVNTGEVVAGDPAAGQALVTGDAVNVAARLEQVAPPGEILIGRATYELARDAVVAEPTDPGALKGKTEAIPAYRLVEVHPTAPAFARRLDSPLVGRQDELGLLAEAFDRAVAERACHLLTILGPAGVGKSRLVEEFLAGLSDGDARVLRGRCLAYGEGITFFPVVEVLKQAADIADFEDPSETDRKICALVEDEDHGSLICARIGQLLGLAEGEAVAQETLWAIRRFLEALARERPVVVVFDDIHWGESTFLDLIEYVAEWTREAPMVLVCPARPELLDVRPGWAGGKPNASTVALEPLPEDESERLLTNLLGEAGVGDKVRSSILEAAEGTPLFVEQVVSMLIDDGLLARQDGRWVARGALSEIRIPPTIAALLAARLDRLSAEERSVIQRASVVGKIFYRGAVGALSPEKDRSAAPGHLLSLVRKELLRPDRTTLPGEDAFRFRHQLIRDAAYESTPKEARAELHERFANWLADVAGERVEEQEEILGYHLEQACRYREQLGQAAKPELRRRARAHLSAAGRRAAARGDMGASASLLRRAVALYDTGDGERRALLTELGLVLLETGPYDEAGSVLREAIEEAEVAGDRLTAAHARIGEVMLRVSSDPEGTGKEATRVADELIPVFEAAGDDLGLARAYRLRSTAPWVATRYSEMAADAERAMEHARRAGHQAEEGFGHEMFAVAYTFGPVPVEEALPRLAAAREELSGMRRELEAESAILLAMAGKLDEARRVLERSRAVFEDLGRPVWAASIQLARGLVELIAGDTLEAERALRLGRDEFLRVGEKGVLSTLSSFLARSLCLQGRFEEAEPFIDESRSLASSEDVASQTGWRTAKAMVLLDRGELDEAERLAREAVALAESGDAPDEHGDALGMLAEVVILGGRPEEAGPLLREAIDRYERKGNVMSAARVRARLAAIAESYGEREDER